MNMYIISLSKCRIQADQKLVSLKHFLKIKIKSINYGGSLSLSLPVRCPDVGVCLLKLLLYYVILLFSYWPQLSFFI